MSNRDYVMARLGAALAANDAQRDMIVAALTIFTDPDDDKDGASRTELITDAQLMCHESASALSFALERMDTLDSDDLTEGEDEQPEEGDDDDDDEGEAGDDGEDPAED